VVDDEWLLINGMEPDESADSVGHMSLFLLLGGAIRGRKGVFDATCNWTNTEEATKFVDGTTVKSGETVVNVQMYRQIQYGNRYKRDDGPPTTLQEQLVLKKSFTVTQVDGLVARRQSRRPVALSQRAPLCQP